MTSNSLSDMLRVVESISSQLELGPLLALIVRQACELTGASSGTLALYDEERNLLRTEAAHGMPASELGAERGPGLGLAGRVLQTGEAVVLDRYADLAQPASPSLVEQAVIGMPIFRRERLLGVIGLAADPPRRFDTRDMETLALFARHAAIAIENARQYAAEKRRTARIAAINRISGLVNSTLSLDQQLQTAIDSLYENFHYAHLAIGLVANDDPQTLVLNSQTGDPAIRMPERYRQSIEQGILGVAVHTRRPVLRANVRDDPAYIAIPGGEHIVSELAIPILCGERLLGVLNVESAERISPEDTADLGIVADQLGAAIDNAQSYAAARQTLAETQLLYETVQRISAALTIDEVIAAYLEQVAARGRYACTVALYELDAEGRRAARVTYGSWSPQTGLSLASERNAYQPDALDAPLDAGQTVAIANVHADPRVPESLRALQWRDGRPALAFIPLLAHGQRVGVIILSSATVMQWPEPELRLYQVTAAHLAATIENRQQQFQLSRREQQLAVLEERQRLARELHDSVTQLVFSVTLIAQSISPAWRRDPAEGERRVSRLLELSQSALSELRALLAELRPPESAEPQPEADTRIPDLILLQREGLVGALRRRVQELAREGLQIELEAEGYALVGRRPPPAYEETLYRVAQEALNNVQKHAHARTIQVRLSATDQTLGLRVCDDGTGFDVRAAQSAPAGLHGGIGLRAMRERVDTLRGNLRLTSTPGSGTVIEVELPIAKAVC